MDSEILDGDARTLHESIFGKPDEPLSDLDENDCGHGKRRR